MSHFFLKITSDGHCSPRSAGACLLFYQGKNQTNNKQLSAIQTLHNIYKNNQLFKGTQSAKFYKLLLNKSKFYTNEVNTAANPGSLMNWRVAKELKLVKNIPVAVSRNKYIRHNDGTLTVHNNRYKNKVLFLHSGSTKSGHWNIALPITQENLNLQLALKLMSSV